MLEVVYIALGSNLGDRAGHLASAIEEIGAIPGCRVIGMSRVEETAPLGGMDQPAYLNQMIAVETRLEPRELLTALQQIEMHHGRQREIRWGARTLDLDIVLFGERSADDGVVTLPHPGLGERPFWQRELAELRGTS
jgi:2-amino-4-hydroxy-6-hydroxymethyldihydropteridine diphosphokinase